MSSPVCVCTHSVYQHIAITTAGKAVGTYCQHDCGCSIFEADDGSDTPGSCCNPDHRSDPYEGQYASNGKYQP